jgi:lysophospholipase L1-like esterase
VAWLDWRLAARMPEFLFHGDNGLKRGPQPAGETGAYRIVCLGDSHTWGPGVADAETYPARLQERLAAANRRPVEVVNLGRGGSCLREKAAIYGRDASFRHDFVVLQVGIDLPRLALHRLNDRRALGLRYHLARGLNRRFPEWRTASRLLAKTTGVLQRRVEKLLKSPEGAELLREAQDELADLAAALDGAAAARGARLITALSATADFRAETEAALGRANLRDPRRLDLERLPPGRELYLPDGHLNAGGYEALAAVLLDALPEDLRREWGLAR